MLDYLPAVRADLDAERPVGATDNIHFTTSVVRPLVEEFSSPGDLVLDPFAGYGTTLLVAGACGRRGLGVELLDTHADVARPRLPPETRLIVGDARELRRLVEVDVDLCLTSPPYMNATAHPENPLTGYATLDGEYRRYLRELADVFRQVAQLMRPGGYVIINVADTGPAGSTPLVADIAGHVARHLSYERAIPVRWDAPPPGIANDTCLVFRALQADSVR